MSESRRIGIGMIFLLYGLFFSCTYEKDIWIKEEKPRVVLNAMILQDSIIRVNLSRSMNGVLLKPEEKEDRRHLFIENAVIELWVNDISKGFLQKSHETFGYGDYLHAYRPAPGDRIRLKASTPDDDPVEAETTIPYPPEIISIDTLSSEQWNEHGELQHNLHFHIVIQDRPDEENYYLLSFEPVTHYRTPSLDTVVIGIPFWQKIEHPLNIRIESGAMGKYGINLQTSLFWGGQGQGYMFRRQETAFLLKDEGADGERLAFDFTASRVRYSHQDDTLSCTHSFQIQLASISRSYYLYRRSKALQKEQDDILGDLDLREPQPTYSNVIAGYGLLASYHPNRICFVLKIG